MLYFIIIWVLCVIMMIDIVRYYIGSDIVGDENIVYIAGSAGNEKTFLWIEHAIKKYNKQRKLKGKNKKREFKLILFERR